jgi:hypothetical protein
MTEIKLPAFIKKQPIALGCALLSLVLAAAIYFRSGALTEAQGDLADKTSQGELLKQNVRNSNELDKQFAAITTATQAIEARLVHADQLAINLQYFYKIESESQAKLTNLQQNGSEVSAGNRGGTYTGIGYTISVQGSYLQLLDFLRRVENGDHYSRVDGLILSSAGGDETTGRTDDLSLNLNLELLGLP